MGFPDALLLAYLALADAAFLAYLRYRRREAAKLERMRRSLRFAVERESRLAAPARRWASMLSRVSETT